MNFRTPIWIYFLAMCCLAGCGGRAYVVDEFEAEVFRERAHEQSEGGVRVRAAVAGADETRMIFGVSLYESDVQPVWIEVENRSSQRVRFAPVGTDHDYFSPQEMPYKHRKGFSDEARLAMARRFHDLAMPRFIEPGAVQSGFVMTHLEPGTKSFNVDLFSRGSAYRFPFFIDIPGFVPDYAAVDFESLYANVDVPDLDADALYEWLSALQCCTTDETGESTGSPINVVLIGEDSEMLYALIRAKWEETAADDRLEIPGAGDYFWRGRKQDSVLRHHGRQRRDGFHELRVWLAPVRSNGQLVWMGQLRHFIDHRWITARADADIDNATWFMLQNIWYSETLRKYAWVRGDGAISIDEATQDFQGAEWFGQDLMTVLWLSGEPVSLGAVQSADWDTVAE